MPAAEHSLALLGAILFIGLLAPTLLRRFHLPFATSLILVGAAVGPHGWGYLYPDDTLTIFALLGACFQMLLAGFEARTLRVHHIERDNVILVVLDGLLPAAVGAVLALWLGFSWSGVLLVAAIYLSSSILLVFSFVDHFKLANDRLGRRLKSVSVVLDLGTTLLAFLLLKRVDPHPRFPLPILLGLTMSTVVILRLFIPEIVAFATSRIHKSKTAVFEAEFRFTLAIMLLALFVFSGLDVPPVVAAFLIGFSLAKVENADVIHDKFRLVGHALFIPVFLFAVGLDTDWRALIGVTPTLLLLVILAIVTKLAGGYAGGRLLNMSPRDAAVIGVISSTKLAVPLTASYAALKAGIIDSDLYTAVIIVSVVTSVLAPLISDVLLRGREVG